MRTIYSQDWLDGTGGWSVEKSRAEAPTVPVRVHVEHPLAEYAIQFVGNGGWAIAAQDPPVTEGTLEISFRAYICSSGRNSLSLNVRDKGGAPVFKFSFGEQGHVWANKQPVPGGEPAQKRTSLVYDCHRPYDLVATHVIGSGTFTLKLIDPVTGAETSDPTEWACRSKAAPAFLDFDQEGGAAVAYLGLIEVVEL